MSPAEDPLPFAGLTGWESDDLEEALAESGIAPSEVASQLAAYFKDPTAWEAAFGEGLRTRLVAEGRSLLRGGRTAAIVADEALRVGNDLPPVELGLDPGSPILGRCVVDSRTIVVLSPEVLLNGGAS